MQDKNLLNVVNEHLSEAIEGLFEDVVTDTAGVAWKYAVFDYRISEFGNSSLSRWTINLCDGQILVPEFPMGAAHPMAMVKTVRRDQFVGEDKFYGILITIYPDGRSEVKFDYDPKCLSKMEV